MAIETLPGSRRLIHAPVPRGVYMLIGPPGAGKTCFAYTFAFDSLRAGIPVLFVAINDPPEEVLRRLEAMGAQPSSFAKLRILDGYCVKSGRAPASEWYLKSLEAPQEAIMAISRALQGLAQPNLCLDSLDPFLGRLDGRTAKIFVENLSAHIRGVANQSLITVSAGAHDERLLSYLRGSFDGIIEMRLEESDRGEGARRWIRYVGFRAKHDSRWMPFAIFGAGVVGIVSQHSPAMERIGAEACRRAVGLGYRMAWFGLVDEFFEKVVPVADSGSEEGYLTTVDIDLGDPRRSSGPTGTAARTGDAVIVGDIETDPSMGPWREEALRRGYRSSAAIPLKVDGKVVAVLNVYSGERAGFPGPMMERLKSIAEEAQESLRAELAKSARGPGRLA